MKGVFGALSLAAGLLLLLHASFSGMHFKSLVRELYGDDSALRQRLPADVRGLKQPTRNNFFAKKAKKEIPMAGPPTPSARPSPTPSPPAHPTHTSPTADPTGVCRRVFSLPAGRHFTF